MKNYNIISLSIENGLNNVPIGTAGGYIQLLESTSGANVSIRLNDRSADAIPLKVYHSIESVDINQIFVSCNPISGGTIKIVQAKTASDFKINTPSSDIKLSALASYDSLALTQLDKIFNPFLPAVLDYQSFGGTALTEILNKTIQADRIDISLIVNSNVNGQGYLHETAIKCFLDGVLVAEDSHYSINIEYSKNGSNTSRITLDNVRGKNISISARCYHDLEPASYILQEYSLKP